VTEWKEIETKETWKITSFVQIKEAWT